jgi:hypothetical protein
VSLFRDWLAYQICKLTLTWIATSWYRDRVDGYIRYGMLSAARDEMEGRPVSPTWRTSG